MTNSTNQHQSVQNATVRDMRARAEALEAIPSYDCELFWRVLVEILHSEVNMGYSNDRRSVSKDLLEQQKTLVDATERLVNCYRRNQTQLEEDKHSLRSARNLYFHWLSEIVAKEACEEGIIALESCPNAAAPHFWESLRICVWRARDLFPWETAGTKMYRGYMASYVISNNCDEQKLAYQVLLNEESRLRTFDPQRIYDRSEVLLSLAIYDSDNNNLLDSLDWINQALSLFESKDRSKLPEGVRTTLENLESLRHKVRESSGSKKSQSKR